MILLDSDVLLDFLTGNNDARMSEWFKVHPERPHTTALAIAEVLHLIEMMDDAGPITVGKVPATGAVRRALQGPLDRRVVPFDVECSHHLARLAMKRMGDGTEYSLATLMTAASVLRHRTELVTWRPEEYVGLGIAAVSL